MSNRHVLCVAVCLMSLLSHYTRAQKPGTAPAGEACCVVDPTWPKKPESFTWGAMSGITVDARDQVYLFNRSEPTVQVYRTDGALVRSWSTAYPPGTHHIRLSKGIVGVKPFSRQHPPGYPCRLDSA